MAQIYEDPLRTATAESALHALQQGHRAAEDYVTDFRCWSADVEWNSAALCYQFRLGLSEPLKDELARVGVPESLEALIDLTIQIDRRLRERSAERSTERFQPLGLLPQESGPSSPSQPSRFHPSLSPEERLYRRQNHLCLYCGRDGHYVSSCPAKIRKCLTFLPASQSFRPTKSSHLAVQISLQLSGRVIQVPAIVDSGACSCFIDLTFALQHKIPLQPKAHGLSIHLADGSHING